MSLRSNLGDLSGVDAHALVREQEDAEQHALDPIADLLPPEGLVAVRLAETARTLVPLKKGSAHVAGVRGSASAALVAEMARTRQVVLVAAELDDARRLAEDVAFFLRAEESEGDSGDGDGPVDADGAKSQVLVFAGSEASPYSDVNPDRRAAMSRMATLFHLSSALPWKVLVLPATALVRKVVPKDVVKANSHRVIAEDEIDRDRLLARLAESGYLRVPVVEDPGSFAVRGSLLDLWPPGVATPYRVELYGDMVVSIKPFDPFEQRTLPVNGKNDGGLAELWLPPAREAVLTKETTARAKDRVSQLADMIDLPTTRARALVDDVVSGRPFFGADGFLPAYYPDLDSLFAYIGTSPLVVLDDPPAITREVQTELSRAEDDVAAHTKDPHFLPATFYATEAQTAFELTSRGVVSLHRTPVLGGEEAADGLGQFETFGQKDTPRDLASHDQGDLVRAVKAARGSKGKTGTLLPLVRRIQFWRSQGLSVFLAARAQTQAERLAGLLRHQGVSCVTRLGTFDPEWLAEASSNTTDVDAIIVTGPLSRGVILPADGLALVTEEEIFGGRAHRRREKKATDVARPFLEDLRSLAVGDYVVHVEHGIGKYMGLVHKDVAGMVVDLLSVEYGNGDKLYLPVYRLNQIQKYTGGEHAEPKLDRLGGVSFAKTKGKVKKAVRQMADELLRLYAERQAQPGEALPPITDDYRAFEATFAFEETPDQAQAIEAVNRDLETARPMDRLVCGDVGFGKTEVAIRAAFRVAMSGKQVALLCPTTVLAQQHFRVFESRMRDYPIALRAMSRFQTTKELNETLALVKEGKVDILVGTHRVLSKDLHFKDLGLLIVDEEQRFGVAHKERIKQLRASVDVLTLTATPIPRTLQMAVSGLRDLSLITTPPVDRRAVRTIVTRFDEQVLKEAVGRELSRGGQVFYVYNRVEGIYEKAQKLQQLFPQARIAVGHGQMARASKKTDVDGITAEAHSNLEKVMLDFVEGRFDILVATAIVESGLDIPRANTIIIDRADLFGLAQLYQLRGRVGRSKERAYCYLIVPPPNAMTDDSRARIEALERHTELGSGFKIASLDLELRGAGDLLGGEQSGNVASVGFDLFVQMLDEAVHELRGEPVVHDVDPELSFDVSALIPEEYVGDTGVRLSLYKRLASALDESHVSEIAVEMEDRFGPPPEEARRLVQLMSVKTELRRLKVLGCEASARSVTLHLREDTPLDPRKILELVKGAKSPYRLTPDMRLTRRFDLAGTNEQMTNGLSNAETLLAALAKCMKADS